MVAALACAGCGGEPATSGQTTATSKIATGWSRVEPRRLPDLQGAGTSLIPVPPGLSLSGEAGRPVLVNLWAGWCHPCVKELPLLQAAESRQELSVVGVSKDVRRSTATSRLKAAAITYPNWMDPDGAYLRGLDGLVPAFAIPSSLLVVDGMVVATHVGPFANADDLAGFRRYVASS